MHSKYYKQIIAKFDNEENSFLPLWMHLRDTMGVMGELVRKWVSDSVIQSCKLEEDMFFKIAIFLAAVHDCGKATSYFQSIISIHSDELFHRLNDSGLLVKKDYINRGKTPHAFAGQCILQSGLQEIDIDESLAAIVGAHHGRPMDERGIYDDDLIETYPANFYGEQDNKEQKEKWSNIWKEIVEEALESSEITDIEELPEININAQVLLSGLLIVADWIASNTNYFPLISLEEDIEEDIYPKRIMDGWAKYNAPEGWNSEISIMDENIFKEERFGFLPNEVQLAVFEAVNNCLTPGIFILEAQMGCGKTEAALSAAEVFANKINCRGMFFALPTQATSNGIYHRLYSWAECVSEDTKNAIELAHSGAQFNKEYKKQRESGRILVDNIDALDNGLMVHPWFMGNKKALLANFVIGTVDQFLMGALKKKHFMLRHLGLAGKVVIIDECHAYDAYMNTYLDRMLEWLHSYGISVILLSATLPIKRRNELISTYVKSKGDADWKHEMGYPLLTWTDGKHVHNKVIQQNYKKKYVTLNIIDPKKSLLKLLDEKLQNGGCACIIANTVKSAQLYYEIVISEMKEANVILYHAQYLMPDRTKKELELLDKMGKDSLDKDRNKLILIGTQVLEQSLDYDTDIMFTELCPIDLLMQRIGRLHRHDRSGIKSGISRPEKLRLPECYILMEETHNGVFEYDAGSKAIYGDYLLTRTKKILPDVLTIPDDIPQLVQTLYCDEDDLQLETDTDYLEMRDKHFTMIGKKKANAKMYLLKEPDEGIMGILSNENKSSDNNEEQQVRDAGTVIEVILMKEFDDENVCFLDEKAYGNEKISKNSIPDNELSQRILQQRIRLPQIFSTDCAIKNTIDELKERQNEIAEWQKSPWLSGELVILFDKDNKTSLNGYKLHYDFSRGLVYDR